MNWWIGVALAAAVVSGPLSAQSIRAPFVVSDYFATSGWMGDGSRGTMVLEMDENYTRKPRTGDNDGKCIRFSWEPRTASWAGLYWQAPAGNWGSQPGRSVIGATKVTFWAAGENGTEVVEFKAGGVRASNMPYKDSFAATLGAVRLPRIWRRYEINLRAQKLSNVIGAFAWVLHREANAGKVIFYLDDIRYE